MILLVSLVLFPTGILQARQERLIDDFAAGISIGWKTKSFKGETRYTVESAGGENGGACLRAESSDSASGLFYEIEYDPSQYPILAWSWKVDNILTKGDAASKAGDDYAARLYVVFPSFFFWKTRAINYIWANKLPVGQAVPNAFTGNAMMIAVRSGSAENGQWLSERRNVYEDFKLLFGEEPPLIGAIAIMTDTDNTGGEASACYGPIRILSE
jgi:hypothetical protein